MPEISRFYGIGIKMFHNDHQPPHFHAEYGSSRMVVSIETLAVMAGKLPPRAMGLVMEWASIHRTELELAWNRATNLEPIGKIDPLN